MLIEVLVAMGLASILLPALIVGIAASREGKAQTKQRVQATALLREAEEATRSIREKGWPNLTNGTFYPIVAGSSWGLATGSENINGFTRQIEISNVFRDISGNIVQSGGILDPSTQKLLFQVSWASPLPSSVESTTYLTRYLKNTAWIQTTQADFSAGTTTSTSVTNIAGGEVQLAPSTGSSWTSPQIIRVEDLPGSTTTNDVYVDGTTAYIVTNNVAGSDFFIYDISNPSIPTLLGSTDLGASGFAVYVADGYAYVATNHNSREMTVVDVKNPLSPQLIGTHFDAPTNADGRSISISGSVAYLVTANNTTGPGAEFYSADISNPTNPFQLGNLDLGAGASDIITKGNYAYIASQHDNQELQVINIINPSSPSFTSTYNTFGNSDGRAIYLVGGTVYLTTRSFYILDVSNLPTVTQIGTLASGGNQQGVFVLGKDAFLASTETGREFKVIDISSPSVPLQIGSVSLGGAGSQVYVIGDYAFATSAQATGEFQIIGGGRPANTYQVSGVYTSQTFNAGTNVAFNSVRLSISKPAGTDIKIQIAINNDNQSWVYFGRDSTSQSFFESSQAIHLSKIQGQYLKFRVFFSGNGLNTPILNEVSINYSP